MVSIEYRVGVLGMKVGDLIKFRGTWGETVLPGERQTGVVMKVWTNGWSGRIQGVDILWADGDISKQFGVTRLEVLNESR